MAAANVRYFRYILFALFGIIVLYLITTSSIPQYTDPIRENAGRLINNLKDSYNGQTTQMPTVAPTQTYSNTYLPEPTSAAHPWPRPHEFNGKASTLSPPAAGERMNATFVTLARNGDVWEIARSIRQVEDRFNRNYNYDWVFLNDKPFDDTFKKVTTSLVSGKTHYGEIDEKHWSFPPWIDQERARAVREDMAQRQIIYGDSISYRHMCRFESGFFFRQPLMMNYEWYWRVEPSVELFCDIHYDPFKFMRDNKKKYSFVLSLYEYVETIPTLWQSTKKFMKANPGHIAADNSMKFLSDDNGETYNNCHFVSLLSLSRSSFLHLLI